MSKEKSENLPDSSAQVAQSRSVTADNKRPTISVHDQSKKFKETSTNEKRPDHQPQFFVPRPPQFGTHDSCPESSDSEESGSDEDERVMSLPATQPFSFGIDSRPEIDVADPGQNDLSGDESLDLIARLNQNQLATVISAIMRNSNSTFNSETTLSLYEQLRDIIVESSSGNVEDQGETNEVASTSAGVVEVTPANVSEIMRNSNSTHNLETSESSAENEVDKGDTNEVVVFTEDSPPENHSSQEPQEGNGAAVAYRVDSIRQNDMIYTLATPANKTSFVFFRKSFDRKKTFLAMGLLFVLISGAVIIAVVFLLKKETVFIDRPPPPPNNTEPVVRNKTEILTMLKSRFYEEDLNNPESSQSKALDWIVNETDILPSHKGIYELVHLASFYFAQGGDEYWEVCSRKKTCEEADGRLSWLSDEENYDYCKWPGVDACSPDGKVSALSFPFLDLLTDLRGTIPNDIGHLSELNMLDFFLSSPDAMYGTLPSELGLLQKLEHLFLDRGKVTGTIPEEIYTGCGQLTALGLHRQSITGTISTDVGKLTNLVTFWLNDSNINGTVPTEFGYLTKLVSIGLHKTNLEGTIPNELCEVDFDVLVVDNNVRCNENCDCLSDYIHTTSARGR